MLRSQLLVLLLLLASCRDVHTEAIAFGPDDHFIASASDDGIVRVWNHDDGSLVWALEDQRSTARAIDFSPDGRSLAAGADDGSIVVWPIPPDSPALKISHGSSVEGVVFGPDGKWLAAADERGFIRVWDPLSGKELRNLGLKSRRAAFAASRDRRYLAMLADTVLRIWETHEWSEIRNLAVSGKKGSVAFSEDGKYISATSDSTVNVWSMESESVSHSMISPSRADFSSVAFLGKVLAAEYQESEEVKGGTFLLDLATGESRVSKHRGWSKAHTLNHSADLLAVSGADFDLFIWDRKADQYRAGMGVGAVTSVDFGPDDQFLVAVSGGRIRRWEAGSNAPAVLFSGHEGGDLEAFFSDDYSKVISRSDDHTAKIWNAISGELLATIPAPGDRGWDAVSSDGRLLAQGDKSGGIAIHDIARKLIIRAVSGDTGSTAIRFGPGGTLIGACFKDKSLIVWNVETGETVLISTSDGDELEFVPDGGAVITGWQTLRLRDGAVTTFEESVPSVKRLATGNRLAAVIPGTGDRVHIFDWRTGRHLREIPIALVKDVAISHDEKRVITGGKNGMVRVFEISSGRELFRTFSERDYRPAEPGWLGSMIRELKTASPVPEPSEKSKKNNLDLRGFLIFVIICLIILVVVLVGLTVFAIVVVVRVVKRLRR